MLQGGESSAVEWVGPVWIAALASSGASALHPSMVELGRPNPQLRRSAPAARLVVLGMALMTTPVSMLVGAGAADLQVVAPVAGAGLIALLILGRMTRLVQDREAAHSQLESRVSLGHGVLGALAAPALIDGHELPISASVGAALVGPEVVNVREALRRADAAMYVAKSAGGGALSFGDEDAPVEALTPAG